MRPIVTDGVAWSVGLSACWSFTIVSPAKTAAEQIEISFGMWTRMGPRKRVLDVGADWRHLANTTESSMCGGEAALCQIITLTTCYYYK